MTEGRVPTGVRRLDDQLQGGLPARTSLLVYGPRFGGKEMLSRSFLIEGLKRGEPGVFITTDEAAADIRAELVALDPIVAEAQKKGLLHFIDAYSRTIGAQESTPNTEYVDGVVNFNGVTTALNNVERALIRNHGSHRVVFGSVSTVIAYASSQAAFRFLQVLVGRARTAGATIVLLLEAGMHSETDVQTIKHLANGFLEFKAEGGRNLLRLEGAGLAEPSGWVDYRVTPKALEITGSFAAGRIR